jgi:hypothetical protein
VIVGAAGAGLVFSVGSGVFENVGIAVGVAVMVGAFIAGESARRQTGMLATKSTVKKQKWRDRR